ncbi:MAG: MATE family efflux transporter [Candidatus Marinimicrobia bacterium]|nr:MATE family efflux transporter [Candidatus Neomarinimicrobiota bacterium]MBT3630808.1 MATE family efflux transporter [Candidatus Neomarinimicrobiota bacterium]MBT4130446.1 MATE family efflux transporter [Candidatus Neomarinimicrobiota bacterium]MBT4294255.1 MATE family efflux transporter [Candidatus Neomarinimicrobiota bacterium]MBT4419786.1 MATE family efflux transporter [Candidatus Neomarinimicrobiota bacterium]
MLSSIKNRWASEFGYRHVLVVAFPLILSTGSWSIQQFVDRMFLSWHSEEALAAAVPAGILNFAFICLFIGTVSYAGTFVSQYVGAKEDHKVGAVLWHSLYLSLFGATMLLLVAPFSSILFSIVGHNEKLQIMESTYFKILCFGGLGPILSSAFAGFFTGQGRNWPVMWVNLFTTVTNLILDYLLIFGIGIFPEMGIAGAALATIIAGFLSIIMYLVLIFRPQNELRFKVWSSRTWDISFMKRFLKYGLPSGGHFFLEIMGFTAFILILGRIGQMELAATNIAININSLAFMPMFGLGIALSMMVGQNIGAGDPEKAKFAANSAVQLGMLYMIFCTFLYVVIPHVFIAPFDASQETFNTAIILLRFVAVYAVFDALSILYSSAIKGAGDTHFVMRVTTGLSIFVLIIPTYVAVDIFGSNLYLPWTFCALFIVAMGLTFLGRFYGGKWKSMRVIETPGVLPSQHPANPLAPEV